ncbi:MAG: ribbon-helix-helix domain-containing protein [Pyrobaculum sp.]
MAKLVLISVHIEKETLEALDTLVKHGVFKSRSEAIRHALHEMLKRDDIAKTLEKNNMKEQYKEELGLEKKLLQGRW